MRNVYESVRTNVLKSILILGLGTIFLSFIAYVLGVLITGDPSYSLLLAGVISFCTAFVSYFFSDKIVLAMSGARPADKNRDFDLYTVTENLTRVARVPMPKLFVIDDTSMNAFATGRNPKHAAVAVTRGLQTRLDRSELEAVIAHELAHVKNYDILVMTLISVLVGTVTLLSDWAMRSFLWSGGNREDNRNSGGALLLIIGLVLAILAPIVGTIIKLAVSRRREYLADATAVKLTRYPDGLIRALSKLGKDREPLEVANKATAHLYIVNPLTNLHGPRSMFVELFSTHPPISKRIAALEAMK